MLNDNITKTHRLRPGKTTVFVLCADGSTVKATTLRGEYL